MTSSDSSRECYPGGSKTQESQSSLPAARTHNGRPGDPALPYRIRGLLPLYPAPSFQRKDSLTKNLSLKGCLDSTGVGESGSPTSKTRKKHSSASFGIPKPPRIPLDRPTPLKIYTGSCTRETPCSQRHPGAASRCHHQAISRQMSLSNPSADSWVIWRPLRPTTRMF